MHNKKYLWSIFSFCMKYLKSVMYFIVHLSLDQSQQPPCLGAACGTASLIGKTALGGSELFGGHKFLWQSPVTPSQNVFTWDQRHGLIRQLVIFELVFSFFSEYTPRSRLAGLYGSSIFSFLGNLHTGGFSQWLHQFTSPPAVWKGESVISK